MPNQREETPESVPAEPHPEPSRRERKKERTRREIYSAAMTLFARDGFDRVTIQQICLEADVAKGTFFLHFATKSALLLEFNRELAAELTHHFEEPRGSASDELRTLVDVITERLLEHAEVTFAMLREFMTTPLSPLNTMEGGSRLLDVIEEIVERGQRRGEFSSAMHPRLAATVFLTTAVSIPSGTVFKPGDVTPKDAQEQFLAIVLDGLATR